MNKFQLKLVVILLAPLLGVAALGYQDILARSIPPAVESSVQRSVIDQPLNWEPFSADVKRIHERDGGTFVGRQYRSSDGSTRSETGRSLESIDVIGIKNIPESTYYNWTPETGWTSQPMLLPPQGWKPFERSYSGRTIDVTDTLEGFKLIKSESSGRVTYQAPQLNMFTVITLIKCSFDKAATCGIWYSNIKLEEPKIDFTPPKGSRVTHIEEPGGIIWKPPVQR